MILLIIFAVMQMSGDPASGSIFAPASGTVQTDNSFPSPMFSSSAVTETTVTTTTATTTSTADPNATSTSVVTTTTRAGTPGKVTASYANVRTGPGSSFEQIKTVYSGEVYYIVGQAEATNGVMWYEIDLGAKTGYICAAFVESDNITINRKAYLTFDDGPSKNTSKVLDILDRYNVKATFFVIYSSEYSDMYAEIVRRGHTIALHSYSHTYKQIYSSETAYFNDLQKLSDYISQNTGVTPNVLRFPGGSSNTVSKKYCDGIMTELTKEVESRGYRYFDWNVDSGDAEASTVGEETIINNIKSRLSGQSRAVILMHDAHSKTTTVDALPEIIEYILSKGYEILPITDETEVVHHGVRN